MKVILSLLFLSTSGCNLLYNVPHPHNGSHLDRAEFYMAKGSYYERMSYVAQKNGDLDASVNYHLKTKECNKLSDQYIKLAEQDLIEEERQLKMQKELLNDLQKLKTLIDSTPPAQ